MLDTKALTEIRHVLHHILGRISEFVKVEEFDHTRTDPKTRPHNAARCPISRRESWASICAEVEAQLAQLERQKGFVGLTLVGFLFAIPFLFKD